MTLAFPFFGLRPSESLLLSLLLLLSDPSELSPRFFFPAPLLRFLSPEPLPSDLLELLLRAFLSELAALWSLARLLRAFLSELAALWSLARLLRAFLPELAALRSLARLLRAFPSELAALWPLARLLRDLPLGLAVA